MIDWVFISGLLLANLAATCFLAGVSWSLQIVQFPLMLSANWGDFSGYVRAQRSRNTILMAFPMLVEAGTAGWLLTTPLPQNHLLQGVGLLAAIWIVTFGAIVPQHSRIMKGYDAKAIHTLIRTQWIRTICWSARAAVMAWVTLLWIRQVRSHIY